MASFWVIQLDYGTMVLMAVRGRHDRNLLDRDFRECLKFTGLSDFMIVQRMEYPEFHKRVVGTATCKSVSWRGDLLVEVVLEHEQKAQDDLDDWFDRAILVVKALSALIKEKARG